MASVAHLRKPADNGWWRLLNRTGHWWIAKCNMSLVSGNPSKTLWLERARCANVPLLAVCSEPSIQVTGMVEMEARLVARPR